MHVPTSLAVVTMAAALTVVPAGTAAGQDPTAYAYFLPNRPGRVVATWDRAVPVTYVIATRQAQPRMFADIKEAFRRARVQTGLRFRYGGRAATSAPLGTPEHPVVTVDFGTADNHPRLRKYGGVVSAVGGPLLLSDGESTVFTGGQITIDVRITRAIRLGFRHCRIGATLMHEIGHVLGLDHVRAPGQLMTPCRGRGNVSGWFHDGDLAGLRRLVR